MLRSPVSPFYSPGRRSAGIQSPGIGVPPRHQDRARGGYAGCESRQRFYHNRCILFFLTPLEF